MSKKLLTNAVSVLGNARREMLNEVEHLVVPVIAMREGVMNDMLYTKEMIEANVQTWNGVPIPVGHPQIDGKHVSANDPQIESNVNIGKVYGAKYEDGELKAEFWINIEKANKLGHNDLITDLENGVTIEVSTGLFSEYSNEAGIFANSSYERVATDIRPDHIAILPGEVGACSIKNGCGAGAMIANCEDKKGDKPCCGSCAEGGDCESKSKELNVFKKTISMIKEIFTTNAQSHHQIYQQLRSALNADKSMKHAYVLDVYDDKVVFERGDSLYQQDYSLSGESVVLADTITQVTPKTEFVPVETNKKNKMDKEKLVKAIIANTASAFTEETKEQLEAFDVNALKQIHDGLPTEKKEVKEVSANTKVDALTTQERETLNRLQANEDKRVKAIKEKVSKHFGLEDSIVANMSAEAVEALEAKITPNADYSALGGAPKQEKEDDQSAFDCNADWAHEDEKKD